MSDISQFLAAASKLKKKSLNAQGVCENFLDRFYCNNL
jgi:hypothetical protein